MLTPSCISHLLILLRSYVISASSPDDYVVSEKADCLGCPVEIDENSEDLNVPLSVSISKYNSISDSTHLFTLHTIGHATRQVLIGQNEGSGSREKRLSFLPTMSMYLVQVVAGFRFKVRFDMRRTTCAKDEHKDLNELCVPDEKNVVSMENTSPLTLCDLF